MLKRMTVLGTALVTSVAIAGAPPALAAHRHSHHASSHKRHHGRHSHKRFTAVHACYGGHQSSNGHQSSGTGSYTGHYCPPGTYSAWDEQWLKTSIKGDLFEIAGGKLAQSKSSSAGVKALGAKLESDHTKSLEEATKLAKELGIEVPTEPTPSEQWELTAISKYSGTAFDQAYTSLEVKDHEQDIEEVKDEIAKGCNEKVRKDAEEELPMLEEHLKLALAAEKEAFSQEGKEGQEGQGHPGQEEQQSQQQWQHYWHCHEGQNGESDQQSQSSQTSSEDQSGQGSHCHEGQQGYGQQGSYQHS